MKQTVRGRNQMVSLSRIQNAESESFLDSYLEIFLS